MPRQTRREVQFPAPVPVPPPRRRPPSADGATAPASTADPLTSPPATGRRRTRRRKRADDGHGGGVPTEADPPKKTKTSLSVATAGPDVDGRDVAAAMSASYNLRSSARKAPPPAAVATVTPAAAVGRRMAPFTATPPRAMAGPSPETEAAADTAGWVDIYEDAAATALSPALVGCRCPADRSFERGTDVAAAHLAQYGQAFGDVMRRREVAEQARLLARLPPVAAAAPPPSSEQNKENDAARAPPRNSQTSEEEDGNESSSSSSSSTTSSSSKHTPLPDSLLECRPRAIHRLLARAVDGVGKDAALPVQRAMPPPTLPRQPHLNTSMRGMLVNWLVEVCTEYKISDDAFHLAVTLIDRMLLAGPTPQQYADADWDEDSSADWFLVERSSFQALGCACTLIAAKLEDRSTPKIEDFCYIADNSFSESRIRELEEAICKHLAFRLSGVTPLHFVNEFLRASHACPAPGCRFEHPILRSVVLYLLALGRLSYELSLLRPSLLAAAAVYLARVTLGLRESDPTKRCRADNPYWTRTLQHYTGYTLDHLRPVVLVLHKYQSVAEETEEVKGVFAAFQTSARHRASLRTAPPTESLGFADVRCSHAELMRALSTELF